MNHLQPTDDIVASNSWNQLVKVTDGSDVTIGAYAYDGRNYRITKAIYTSGTLSHTDHFYYNEDWQALEVRRETSGTEDPDPREQYVWHPEYIDALALRYYDADTDGNLAENNDGPHYVAQGANYHVLAITDDTGTVLERYHYNPYGHSTVLDPNFTPDADNTSDIDNPYTFTGRRLDAESGLHYFRNRYYDTSTGRFPSRDQILYVDGLNLYSSYMFLDETDPHGNAIGAAISLGFAIGGVAKGVGHWCIAAWAMNKCANCKTQAMSMLESRFNSLQRRYPDDPLTVANKLQEWEDAVDPLGGCSTICNMAGEQFIRGATWAIITIGIGRGVRNIPITF